jgi:GNAT superfamily N-acetyltransferase
MAPAATWRVTPALEARREPLAQALAQAFRDNPLNRAVIRSGPRRRLRSNLAGMRMSLASTHGQADVWAAEGVGGGALGGGLIALPPFTFPLPPPPLALQIRAVLGQGLATSLRWAKVYSELEALHPIEPHWYLAILGVAPDQQGRGCGRALLARWLEDVDRDGMPAYLETDRRENVDLYAGFDFSVLSEIKALGVPVWRLWRDGSKNTQSAGDSAGDAERWKPGGAGG